MNFDFFFFLQNIDLKYRRANFLFTYREAGESCPLRSPPSERSWSWTDQVTMRLQTDTQDKECKTKQKYKMYFYRTNVKIILVNRLFYLKTKKKSNNSSQWRRECVTDHETVNNFLPIYHLLSA